MTATRAENFSTGGHGFLPAGCRIEAALHSGPPPGSTRFERNLIIVHTQGAQDISDFTAVKRLIAERAPDIEVFLVTNDVPQSATRKKASGRPTLLFSPHFVRGFQPARGKIYSGQILTKLRQVRMLEDAGIPVPKAVFLNEDTRFARRSGTTSSSSNRMSARAGAACGCRPSAGSSTMRANSAGQKRPISCNVSSIPVPTRSNFAP